jgi:Protein of unknown function (DUF4232)
LVVAGAALVVPLGSSLGAAQSGASTLAQCHLGEIGPAVGRSSGAAGTTYVTLLIVNYGKGTNSSTGSCTLSGTPATQFGNLVGSGGPLVFRAVGPAATKLTVTNRGKTVVLKPGAVASVTIGIQTAANYAPSRCHKANVSGVRLLFPAYPIGNVRTSGFALDYTLHTTAVCTKLASTTTSGVVLGTRYP